MSRIFVRGIGAVSPAGWGIEPLLAALRSEQAIPAKELARPGWKRPLRVRQVPAPDPRPAFLAQPRLRRSSPISQYAVASALEALGDDASQFTAGAARLGIVLCVMSGCVNYSRRFYDEVLRDPATASPLVFPETVFNAPSSHLAALLGTTAINYTLVGDPGTYLQGLALAAEWLSREKVEGCLVVGSEEMDWLTADAFRMFSRRLVLSDGAGALYLRRESGPVELAAVTDAHLFIDRAGRICAARKAAAQLRSGVTASLLCDGRQDIPQLDHAEAAAWNGWAGPTISPKRILGEGLMAAAAWQCVAAVEALTRGPAREALVNVAGCNQQVIGAKFARTT
jgi:hypothetical protein